MLTTTKSRLATVVLTVTMAGSVQAQAYANVTVGGAFAPGVYGQISIANNPLPPVMNVRPVIVGAPVYGAAPMYLHVAPEEYRDWGHHCGRYHACGHPVHFVQVEERNPWWNHHAEYLRGPSSYNLEEARRIERRHNASERHERYERPERRERELNRDHRFEGARSEH